MTREVRVLPDGDAFASAVAEEIAERNRACARIGRRFKVCLSGGETPLKVFAALKQVHLDWTNADVFWVDERAVPPESARSNYGNAWREFFQEIREARLYRIEGEGIDIDESARRYADLLEIHVPRRADRLPQFDLVLLGVGADGHVASIFPGDPEMSTTRACYARFIPQIEEWRVTLSMAAINAAECCLIIAQGKKKQQVVQAALSGGDTPIALVRPTSGTLIWMLDQDAAGV